MTESSTSRDQILTLKVMRLTRPSFASCPTIPVDPVDTPDQLESMKNLHNALSQNTVQKHLTDTFGDNLILPQNFENIHLGETFTCYVCVNNDSAQIAQEVSLKVDLQTSSVRHNLPSRYQEAVPELGPDQALGEVISHEVKEIGQHILVCAVNYNAIGGEKMQFRKFFKFPVSKPLDVRTKFYNAESDDVYLEAQIQNTTQYPMVMEKVTLEPADLYLSTALNSIVDTPKSERSVFEETPCLNPQDTRQYLYCLSPKAGIPPKNYRGVTPIGKLDMVWRTHFGERGRLQTSQLQRMAPGYGDLRLTVEKVPSTVEMNKVFEIICKLHNCCDRALDLQLTLEAELQPNLIWCSTSGRAIGEISANSTQTLSLQVLPVAPGLQALSGIRLTDTFLKRTYEHDEIAQVFVSA